MRNPIYHTELNFEELDLATLAEVRVHVDQHQCEVGDTVVLVGEEGTRVWGPVLCIESTEVAGKVAALTIQPQAAFGKVFTP